MSTGCGWDCFRSAWQPTHLELDIGLRLPASFSASAWHNSHSLFETRCSSIEDVWYNPPVEPYPVGVNPIEKMITATHQYRIALLYIQHLNLCQPLKDSFLFFGTAPENLRRFPSPRSSEVDRIPFCFTRPECKSRMLVNFVWTLKPETWTNNLELQSSVIFSYLWRGRTRGYELCVIRWFCSYFYSKVVCVSSNLVILFFTCVFNSDLVE